MNPRLVLRIAGLLLYVLGANFAVPLLLALLEGWWTPTVRAYLAAACITIAAGILMRAIGASAASERIYRKDAVGIVALVWLCLGVLGALPFVLEGAIPSVSGAIFEAVSGFTTTGATVVADVDGLSRATNLWRCQMHLIGGMGIVVLFVAIFPQLGVGAKQLFRAEATGPTKEGFRPRIKQTALRLWWIYAAMTATCAILLWVEGMSPYDAACHAMSALGTGGFSTRTASIGAWDSPAIHWTTACFMFLAGLNFGLYYAALHGRVRDVLGNAELRFYVAVNLAVIALVFAFIVGDRPGIEPALRHAVFQTLSVTTTTGFMTEDFDTYPDIVRWVLLGCMFMGGSAGSTAGGLKAVRVLILIKLFARELSMAVRPEAVVAVRLGRQPVLPPVVSAVAIFFVAYIGIFFIVSAALMTMGLDLLTGMSATIACLSSIGPGLNEVGPSQNYAAIPAAGKLLLSFCMIAGRLELFVLFAVFTRDCWRR
jgi:trk system potassium uptake protein TrkH